MQTSQLKLTEAWLETPYQIQHLEELDLQMITKLNKENRIIYYQCLLKITNKVLQMSLLPQTDGESSFAKKTISMVALWQIYTQLLMSYCFSCLEMGLDKRNWLFCWFSTYLLLQDCQLQAHPGINLHQQLLEKLMMIKKKQKLTLFFRNRLFHQLCKLLRIFITRIDDFISSDNKLIMKSVRHPETNSCNLLMDIIKSQLIRQGDILGASVWVKLDCMMLLMTVMETKIKPSPNYNQILQFAIYIALIVQDQDKEQGSSVLFYCGQLIGMVIYRNCHQVVKLCRAQKQNKMLNKIIRLYRHSLQQVSNRIDYDEVVYKRLVLGFCGLLQINKMETIIEDTIKEEAGRVIGLIERHHGWSEDAGQIDPIQGKQADDDSWDEEYYNKHWVSSFEEQQVVEVLLRSVGSIQEHNCQIFQAIMEHFDEKQSMLWMLQLEKLGQQEDPQ